jgi:hypothetical protein
LRLDGSKLFSDGSIQISENTPIGSPIIIPSTSGRTIFMWNDATVLSSTITQMYDTLGNKLWNENGVVVSYPAIAYQTTTDGQGGFITSGTINQFTIVAQQVSRNGNLGEIIPIPVELISFSGTVDNNKVILSWITATELNNYGFEILKNHSSIISQWEKIGFVSGYGTTAEIKTYSYTDEDVSSGVYKYRLKQIDFDGTFEYSNEIRIEVDFTPKEFVLNQNYPNPFNPVTLIKWQQPVQSHVLIKVYDILGNEIAVLVNEEKPAGNYSVNFDASANASGVYFYSITGSGFNQVKKMILAK